MPEHCKQLIFLILIGFWLKIIKLFNDLLALGVVSTFNGKTWIIPQAQIKTSTSALKDVNLIIDSSVNVYVHYHPFSIKNRSFIDLENIFLSA